MAKNNSSNNRVFVNKDIRAREVRCISASDENLGVMPTYKAIKLAEESGLDLVQISYNKSGSVCKIMDYGKYKYELSKKEKLMAKKQRESVVKVKEIKFRPNTDINDLETKARNARKFLDDGCRVKIIIKFKGRELSHKDVARARLDEFIALLGDGVLVTPAQMDGKNLITMITTSAGKVTSEFKAVESIAV